MFGRDHLRQVVDIVGRTLEKEDGEIRAALLSNPYYQDDGAMGLWRVDNEHYYQFLAWKGLVSSTLPFCVVPEKNKADLWIGSSPDDPEPLACGEMKRWMESGGAGEGLRGIKTDVQALRKCRYPAFMLITTVYDPLGEDQIQWLAERLLDLDVKREDFEVFSFPTLRVKQNQREELRFALIGFMVPPAAEKPESATAGKQ